MNKLKLIGKIALLGIFSASFLGAIIWTVDVNHESSQIITNERPAEIARMEIISHQTYDSLNYIIVRDKESEKEWLVVREVNYFTVNEIPK